MSCRVPTSSSPRQLSCSSQTGVVELSWLDRHAFLEIQTPPFGAKLTSNNSLNGLPGACNSRSCSTQTLTCHLPQLRVGFPSAHRRYTACPPGLRGPHSKPFIVGVTLANPFDHLRDIVRSASPRRGARGLRKCGRSAYSKQISQLARQSVSTLDPPKLPSSQASRANLISGSPAPDRYKVPVLSDSGHVPWSVGRSGHLYY